VNVRYQRSQNVLVGTVGTETVLMGMEVESYFALNRTAGVMWELLAHPITREALTEGLLARYRVSPDNCAREVDQFLTQLVARRLVMPVPD